MMCPAIPRYGLMASLLRPCLSTLVPDFVLHHFRRFPGHCTWRLLYSPDLTNWSAVAAEGVADGSAVSIPVTPESRGFFRLQLERR